MRTTELAPIPITTQVIHGYAAPGSGARFERFDFAPKPLGHMDVEVRVTHCGICHTDLHLLDNDWGISSYPFVPGHEVVGVVAEAGSGVRGLRIGQRVGIGWLSGADFTCEQCIAGQDNLCAAGQPLCLGREGGYADRIRVDSRYAFPVPEALRSEHAAPLLCAGITVFAPLHRHAVGVNKHLGVVGIGGLGHLALQYGRAFGCRVTAFSSSAQKEADAMRLGADDFVDIGRNGALARNGNRCDFILSTVSADLPWADLLGVLKPGGMLCLVGVPRNPVVIDGLPMILGQKSVISSLIGSRSEMQAMLEFSARNQIVPQIEQYPMSEVNTAFDRLRENRLRYRAVLVNE